MDIESKDTVFAEHVFPLFQADKHVKPQMNGLADPTSKDFQPLSMAVAKKEEYKEDEFEQEFIKSFLHAAKVIADAGKKDIARPGMYCFFNHSYALPVLYMTRHCMELSIKRAIRRLGGKNKTIHDLDTLWNTFLNCLPSQKHREDRRAIKNMGQFVKAISELDKAGAQLRYPKNRDGSYTQNRFLWVNGEEIVVSLELFVKQLEAINVN